jgi:OmpA-OmpF porin, OOP family
MKNLKLGVSVLALGVATSALAQTTTNKWAIGVGAHGVNHVAISSEGVGGAFKSLTDTKEGLYSVGNYKIMPPLSKLTVARNLNKYFVADFQATVGNIGNNRFSQYTNNSDGRTITLNDRRIIDERLFVQAGLGLQFKLQALINNENSWFDPYFRLGGNYLYHDYSSATYPVVTVKDDNQNTAITSFRTDGGDKMIKNHITVAGGIGSNFWITKNFGLNIQGDYVNTPFDKSDVANFWQASASIMFRFGQVDTDKDGIYDNEDKCPTVAGPKENAGCPWPDTDKDGTLDKDDKCPTVAGPKENAGCPFPDTDGDGVLDKDDKCPTVAGVKENNGCPKTVDKKIVADEVSKAIKGVFFDFGKSTIKKESNTSLDAAAALLKKEGGTYLVEGHTDKKGKEASNVALSQRRAKAVVLALEERGVAADQLKSKGLGSKEAMATAKASDSERSADRKVIFKYTTGAEWDAIQKYDFTEPVKGMKKATKAAKKVSKKK